MKNKSELTSKIVFVVCLVLFAVFISQLCKHKQAFIISYTDLIGNATQGFSVYQNTNDESDYWRAVASYGAAVNSILTIGEDTDIYKERQSLMAVYQVLLNHPQWLNNEMEQLIAALENIADDPLHRSSYDRLLVFYNSCNAENK